MGNNFDVVKKPKHYQGDRGLEASEVLDNFLNHYPTALLGYWVGNSIKYVLRAPYKNGEED